MELYQIILIATASALALLTLSLLIAFVTYKITFARGGRRFSQNYLKRVASFYNSYGDISEKLSGFVRSREYEEKIINSYDGKKLFAKFYKTEPTAPIHILFHGYRSKAELDMAGAIYECLSLGHNVLLVDQRAHGKSEGGQISFGILERLDVLSWCRLAQEEFGAQSPIFIWGVSMGAATVLSALDLPLPENVAGVIADCPYSSPSAIIKRVGKKLFMPMWLFMPFIRMGAKLFGGFGIDSASAEGAIVKSKLPILLIHGTHDSFVPYQMSEALAARAKDAGVNLSFYSFEEARHAASYLTDSERYREIIRAFVAENGKEKQDVRA